MTYANNAMATLIDCQEWLGNGPLSQLLSERTMQERISNTIAPANHILEWCLCHPRHYNQLQKLATLGNYIDSASRATDAMRLALATYKAMRKANDAPAIYDESDITLAALAMLAYRKGQ